MDLDDLLEEFKDERRNVTSTQWDRDLPDDTTWGASKP